MSLSWCRSCLQTTVGKLSWSRCRCMSRIIYQRHRWSALMYAFSKACQLPISMCHVSVACQHIMVCIVQVNHKGWRHLCRASILAGFLPPSLANCHHSKHWCFLEVGNTRALQLSWWHFLKPSGHLPLLLSYWVLGPNHRAKAAKLTDFCRCKSMPQLACSVLPRFWIATSIFPDCLALFLQYWILPLWLALLYIHICMTHTAAWWPVNGAGMLIYIAVVTLPDVDEICNQVEQCNKCQSMHLDWWGY